MAARARDDAAGHNRWTGQGQTRSWRVASAVWLVFLVSPLWTLFSAVHQPWRRGLGVALIAVFAVVYLATFWSVGEEGKHALEKGRSAGPQVWWGLAGEVTVAAAMAVVSAPAAVMFLPYVVAVAVYLTAWPVVGAVMAVGAICLVATWRAGWGGASVGIGLSSLLVLVLGLVDRHDMRRSALVAAQRAEMARSRERERIAAGVHDLLGQSLTAMAMRAELVARQVDTDPAAARAGAEELHGLCRQALGQVRELVSGLRDVDLDTQLEAARQILALSGVKAEVSDTRTGTATGAEEQTSFDAVRGWVLREAVTNVVRHAGATVCHISLDDDTLGVVDDGAGVGQAPEGNGRTGMRRRAEQVGATLQIGPGADGEGTSVVMSR